MGSGPAAAHVCSGGFDATIEKWTTQGVYAKVRFLDHLPKKYTCIVFDRRECGQSGGRVERVRWADYVAQGRASSTTSASSARTSWAAAWAVRRSRLSRSRIRNGAEHGPVLADGRSEIPHLEPPALLPSTSPM
jgi:hypothetical protein